MWLREETSPRDVVSPRDVAERRVSGAPSHVRVRGSYDVCRREMSPRDVAERKMSPRQRRHQEM